MKNIPFLVLALLLILSPSVQSADKAAWDKVTAAVSKGLPKTAIEELETIMASAKQNENWAEAIKALAMKISMEGQIEGQKAEEKITRLESEIPNWPDASKPVLKTILANWYWQYFQQNRWRFMQRTQTDAAPGTDITTWDLPRIFKEIDKHFTAALSDVNTLQSEPIANYDDLLSKGNVPDSYRPRLYDFIAFEALNFYQSGEQAGSKSQDSFVVDADSPVFDSVERFLTWKPKTTDADSINLKAIQLLQQLLAFHQNDENRDAFADADLVRLNFAHNKSVGANKTDRFIAALKTFSEQWQGHPISARARADWATQVMNEGDYVQAHQIASKGMKEHPESVGSNECFNIIQQIEVRDSSLKVERVWNQPTPEILLDYRNIENVYFRMYRYDWNKLLNDKRYGIERLDRNAVKALLKTEPNKQWHVELEPTEDYQTKQKSISVPADLDKGFYFIISSHSEDFLATQENETNIASAWVSDLALIIRKSEFKKEVQGFVLNAITGEPIKGVEIKGWLQQRQNKRSPLSKTWTDKDGLFKISSWTNRSFVIQASYNGDQITTANDINTYSRQKNKNDQRTTYFFTDRSLYRPGQTIQYKGLSVLVNQEKSNYVIEKNKSLTVVFADVNGQEISKQSVRTNKFGSFSGSFTAPRDRLMGRMRIYTSGNSRGSTNVTVEEYKRPKFKVTVDKPTEAAKLNSEVTVNGKAMTYSGAAVDSAKVTFRVVREVRYPSWWAWRCWWLPPGQTNSQEITHGTLQTDVEGAFTIKFTALPDQTVLEEDEPTFNYTIYTDVTDNTGETRSTSQTVSVGYTAIKAELTATDWQVADKPVEIKISTQTLDGKPLEAKGTINIYHLKEPDQVQRGALAGQRPWYPRWIWRDGKRFRPTPKPDLSNPNSWELAEVHTSKDFATDELGQSLLSFKLESGIYRAILETTDKFGKAVSAQLPIQVYAPNADQFELKLPHLVTAPDWSVEPGEEFMALWGTGYDQARAYIEIEHRGKILSSGWSDRKKTQAKITQQVRESMRGGFIVRVTQVRENRAYLTQRKVDVPWSNKQLSIKWTHHTNKLLPGQQETWTATVTGPDAEAAVVEMAAGLYDESLDAYLPHRWATAFNGFYQERQSLRSDFQNFNNSFNRVDGYFRRNSRSTNWRYRSFPNEIGFGSRRVFRRGMAMPSAVMSKSAAVDSFADAEVANEAIVAQSDEAIAGEPEQEQPKSDLDNVSIRENLNETAFFFPNLITKEDGSVDLEFTIPEAMTSWKFFAFAHDAELRSGFLEDSVITQKDIMVQPNPPRFLRESDELEFTVKVINLSDTDQSGDVRLTFDRLTPSNLEGTVDEQLGNNNTDQTFSIPAKQSRTFSWKLTVPDGEGVLTYKAVASTGKLSDGETGSLPVLPRRILVTESIPLPIRDASTKQFDFKKLIDSANSDSLKHESLTVQMVSNPSWYAVMALPYLMEYPHQCSEQIFNRMYANALGRHIATSDKKIEQVFEQWRGTEALDSPLEKNQDLKAVMLEETPWLRQAKNESQARRNVGILFDQNRLNSELAKAQKQLAQRQLNDGSWAWFPGGKGNDYITLYITTGYARMRHLGVEKIDMKPAFKAISRLDNWITEHYNDLEEKQLLEKNNLNQTIALYLYCRSFYLKDQAVNGEHKQAVDYFLSQAEQYWLKLNRQSQGHIALALKRFGVQSATPTDIVNSIREYSKNEEELGMYWRDTEYSYWWYRAPIETQAMMIELFDEVANDQKAVEDLKVWLLKQKQTQDWKTTKATADAVYALLLRGEKLLSSNQLVEVSLGDTKIKPEKVEAGTGFYEQKFFRSEIKPEYGKVTVTKKDKGVAWGSLHWQYLESMEKITPHEGTPLTLVKKLFTKINTKKGPTLTAVNPGDAVKVGDELVVRLELRTDRDMEYVHLKDQRGAGTEPVNVLSSYKYQDGLGYYESTRDTASHFFIDYLPKGTYVFEYSVRVQHKGNYQSGMANIQCMYAPEFNSHSESFALKVN